MIKNIKLENFKCFEELDVEMSLLNVFAGINSMGKSTAIQALLLLRQSYEMGSLDRGIYLNGDLVSLGTGYDILYRNSQSETISLGIRTDNIEFCNRYKYKKDSDFQKISNEFIYGKEIERENLFGNNFAYVSAERRGPQKYYTSSYHEIYEKNQVGTQGEYFVGYLSERGRTEKIENPLVLHPTVDSDLLIYQMGAWMSEISPDIHLNPKKYQEAGLVSLGYTILTEPYTPVNVGFGLSYVAPIVLALLKARKGDLVILENPEAHLHPRGQRKMGELISRVSAGGVQVIVETHSDHLLNGIRLAVKTSKIHRLDIRLNYFYRTMFKDLKIGNIMKHEKCSPMIMDDGSLTDWPDGFFDEWDKALEELF